MACPCGRFLTRRGFSQHLDSDFHMDWLRNQVEERVLGQDFVTRVTNDPHDDSPNTIP